MKTLKTSMKANPRIQEMVNDGKTLIVAQKTSSGNLLLEHDHNCLACSSVSYTDNNLSSLVDHLSNVHNLTLVEYCNNFDLITKHKFVGVLNDIKYSEQIFEKIYTESELSDEQKDKKPFIKINGEIVKRIRISNLEAYQRMKMVIKKKKTTNERVAVGGLAEEDFSYIPKVDPNFDLTEKFHKQLVMFSAYPGFRVVLLTGDTGLGKSESVVQVAANMNQPIIRIALTGDTKVKDIFQDENFDKKQQKIVYVDKAILQAMKNGYWLIVDEFSAGNPTVMFIFFQIMETGSVTTFDGEVIKAHPMFKLFLTDNRIGNPNYYRYHGTMQQNTALLNRIKTTIVFDNLKPSIEKKILKAKYPDADDGFVENLMEVAKLLRAENEKGNFQETFPIRTLQSICDNYEVTKDALISAELGYLNMLTDEADKKMVEEIFKRKFGTTNKTDDITEIQ